MKNNDGVFTKEPETAYENTQPEFWCGARPCGECEDAAVCVLRDIPVYRNQAERNTAAILRALEEIERRDQKNGKRRYGRYR